MIQPRINLEMKPSICRNCLAYCPIIVTLENDRPVKVVGDPIGTPYGGYICPKGRALPEQHNDPARLLKPLRRNTDGTFVSVTSNQAVMEVTERLRDLVNSFGPDAIALYTGTGPVSNPTGQILDYAFFRALGSSSTFSSATLDKPAAHTSTALHGNWMAGSQRFETADTWMIVGANPVLAKSNGVPFHNPGVRLKEAQQRGLKLIVIDPRQTETTKRAWLHLQPKPGEDPTLLAAIINIILTEGLEDGDFLAENAEGLDELRRAVAPFTPRYAAERADVPLNDILRAAHTFAAGPRGGVVCSTGPNFAEYGDLSFYLGLCLNTICGRWGRAGDRAAYQNILLPAYSPKAQPYPPYPVFGPRAMRVHGLRQNASGLPASSLADEILMPGDGQIKALFCVGGNPMQSWPLPEKTRAALEALELLVVFDYRMTLTAESAHYVIPPPLSLEIPGATYRVESLKYMGVSRGYEIPWAQYADAVAVEPAGSDLMDDGSFLFRVAQALNLQLEWVSNAGFGPHIESPPRKFRLDMSRPPSVAEMIEMACSESRVPLDDVRSHKHGHLYDEIDVRIAPRDPDCTAMLQLGDPLMMDDLAHVYDEASDRPDRARYPFLLMPRRSNNFMNSVGQTLPPLHKGTHHNPVHLHPSDMAAIGVGEGQLVRLASANGEMLGAASADPSLKPGTVTTWQGFGHRPDQANACNAFTGSSVTGLIGLDRLDPITGMPLMSAVPVSITKVASPAECSSAA
ncbi:MAG: molybdopterin-dependent oxidoreductase [Sphingobium sp.]|nr:molybdopterin-dependent oxidoreductase [Sphingobium sp.]